MRYAFPQGLRYRRIQRAEYFPLLRMEGGEPRKKVKAKLNEIGRAISAQTESDLLSVKQTKPPVSGEGVRIRPFRNFEQWATSRENLCRREFPKRSFFSIQSRVRNLQPRCIQRERVSTNER